MRKQYHILNGDVLRGQFPQCIQGEIIVARECLVDGSVKSDTLKELFDTRAKFICNNYDGFSAQDYFERTVPEFEKMQHIPEDVDVNLWFEDDLFCQVNFWFVINLLSKSNRNNDFFLVRPDALNRFGFGGLNELELMAIYEERLPLTELDKLTKLWESYQRDDTEELLNTSMQLKDAYPFILDAVNAHIERIPSNGSLGRPILSLIQIMDELNTTEFGPVFTEFCKREIIYGFGDLQVKRLLDGILNKRRQ